MTRTVRTRAALAAAILALLPGTNQLLGQAAPAEPLPQANLQAHSNEVLLDLVVRDKRNRPVLNLASNQLEVTDNGAPVALTQLRLVNGPQPTAPLITLLFDRPAEQKSSANTDDHLFTAADPGKKLNENALKLLRAFPAAGFEFAVMDVWGRLQIQQEFSSDHKALATAVAAAVQPGPYGVAIAPTAVEQRLAQIAQNGQDSNGKAAGTRERALARAMIAALTASAHVRKDQHLSSGLACLLALVEAQQSISGRKAVIYFTESKNTFGSARSKATSDSQSKKAIQSVIGAANRAGVSIYVVRTGDLEQSKEMALLMDSYATANNGATMVSPSSFYTPGASGTVAGGFAQAKSEAYSSVGAFRMMASKQAEGVNLDGLDALAQQTGGSTLDADVSLDGPVKAMARDLTTYYEASYTPPAGEEDGSFHAIAIKPLRSGLKVRARSGYLALPRSAGIAEPPQAYELPLMALLNRAQLPTEVDYRATVLRLGRQQNGTMNMVAIETPLAQLEIHKDENTHLSSAHLTVLANIKDAAGTVIERFSEDIPRRWTEVQDSAAEVIAFTRSFSAPPGAYVLETALLDNLSGKSAGRRQPFQIADSSAVPELSDLVLVRKTEPVEADQTDDNSLLYGDRTIEPNLSGELPADGKNLSIYLLAHTDPLSTEPAELKLEVLRDGELLQGAVLTTKLQAGSELHPVMNSFSISSAAAGEYQLRATLAQGAKSAVSTGEFTLPGTGRENQIASASGNGAALVAEPPTLALAAPSSDRPPAEELERLLAEARKSALAYTNTLPNLICQQSTRRFTDASGNGRWQQKDILLEVLTYVDHDERRTEIGKIENGAARAADTTAQTGILSAGEFGEALSGIFLPGSMASFEWKQSGTLRGEPVEIFDYQIEQAHSTFSLRASTSKLTMAAYHGRIYVDRATHGVRSLTLITDHLPANFPLKQVAVRIDYDYVALNDHDFLLPIGAQIVAGQSGKSLERNDLEFTNFRRYGSSARIVAEPATDKK